MCSLKIGREFFRNFTVNLKINTRQVKMTYGSRDGYHWYAIEVNLV